MIQPKLLCRRNAKPNEDFFEANESFLIYSIKTVTPILAPLRTEREDVNQNEEAELLICS